ncbi:efflux RND transporter periplasmic adaptor subunit [Clostridium bovifaecis]|uniref:Efflux RND transporter periplasmic adaptor subunit n=1 Tax=Clostridium bovifaecis TaxID=2184719 RepID=A0A6I6F024_9CLOT|nr:efflux RND transporter periplasmic adaptor subunit [Clostridium bovifaecis]
MLTLIMLSGCGAKEDTATTTQEEYTPIEVAAVKKDTIYNSTMITGKVSGKTDVAIIPKIAGKVAEVSVKVGQEVKAGQTIAILDKVDLQNRVEQAKASMNTAAVGIEQSKSAVASASVGMEQAQVALQQAQDGIKSIQASYNLAKANYDANYEKIQNAKLNLERSKALYEQGIISKAEYEQAQLAASDNTIKVLEAQLAQAEESLNQSNNGVNQAKVAVRQAQAGYEQANTGVKQAQSGYEQAKVAYDQALRALNDAVITSPVDGVVYAVNVEKGEIASSAQPIATITSVDKVYVKVDVTEKLVTKLQKGNNINLEISSISDKKIPGIITLINPVANLQNNLYTIEIEVDNKDHQIKPGMFAKAQFNTDNKKDVMVINSEAVTVNNKKQIVYVEQNGKAVEKEVETGLDNGEYVEIKKGITLNEKVIVKGQDLVENGDKVKVVGGAK